MAWERAEENDLHFFGVGMKPHKGYLKRLKDRLENQLNSERDPQAITKMTIKFKEMQSCIDLHLTYLAYGVQSAQFLDQVHHKESFLKMEPKVDKVPMPPFSQERVQ